MNWDVDIDNGDKGYLYDAHGLEVRLCERANLTTGEVVVLFEDEGGRIHPSKTNPGQPARCHEFRAAPLRFEATK